MNTTRILLVSFYYLPDLCAGSFRASALVDALVHPRNGNVAVDVLTTVPQRYESFHVAAAEQDAAGRVSIRRVKLPPHRSGMVDQARGFVHFARAAAKAAGGPYDLVVATSSRLMTASLGAWLATRLHAPLYLDIRDIFAENIRYILPRAAALPLQPTTSALERWTINRAVHVNLVSRGFARYFESRYPRQSLSYFTNGVDDEFLPENLPAAPARSRAGDPVRIVYAGNMGEGQGLHAVVPALARALGSRARFTLIGDGGRRRHLEQAIAQCGAGNVEILDPMARGALIAQYRAADVLFLHLNDYDAFKKVLPSKIFEYAALGKPIWAGVSGHSAEFLREEVSNVAVFEPCGVEGGLRAFEQLDLRDTARPEFIRKYARGAIMRRMADDILARVPGRTAAPA
jgi:glycosyltransferase involved in cell wall biosynthesis